MEAVSWSPNMGLVRSDLGTTDPRLVVTVHTVTCVHSYRVERSEIAFPHAPVSTHRLRVREEGGSRFGPGFLEFRKLLE